MSDTILKNMLTSLRESLHHDMSSCFNRMQADIQDLSDRVDQVEDKMCDYAESFNTLVDARSSQNKKIACSKFKVAKLENRSHRN